MTPVPEHRLTKDLQHPAPLTKRKDTKQPSHCRAITAEPRSKHNSQRNNN
jgi:hypothetical protein